MESRKKKGITEYKSPPHKLIRFFEKSRDQWKGKCSTAKAMVKLLTNRARYLEQRKNRYKRHSKALKHEVAKLRATIEIQRKQLEKQKKRGSPGSGVADAARNV